MIASSPFVKDAGLELCRAHFTVLCLIATDMPFNYFA
jgi:hypothetical protein